MGEGSDRDPVIWATWITGLASSIRLCNGTPLLVLPLHSQNSPWDTRTDLDSTQRLDSRLELRFENGDSRLGDNITTDPEMEDPGPVTFEPEALDP